MDTIFLIISKVVWAFLRPETLLLLLFGLPFVLLHLGRVKAASRSLGFALTVALCISIFPVGNLVLNPLERTYQSQPQLDAPTGIIVLGGAEDIGPDYTGRLAQVNHAGERLITTIELARQFPEAIVLYSGGKVAITPAKQGAFEVGPDILRQLGLPEDRLIIEGRSRSTAENAVLARAMVTDGGTGTWILITSASHMPRAMGSFCAAGWQNLIPYPTDYRGGAFWDQIGWSLAKNLVELNTGVKEWVGLLAYRITGRTEAIFPKNCD
ncbi:YdcF family protein [Tateyamaria pelophila]|uniref:YdcF family protein n=1 Tax=Tateyamaria pelophila TaxID=328415 RepID=UPI001CBE04EE|nr:YdcF family protein [Tateyamaria pelophila]